MILSQTARIMSDARITIHPILTRRTAREWTQAELAQRAGISRAAVSAIEGARLTPSVTAALALAAALECSVEELFGRPTSAASHGPAWAWQSRIEPCRYWEAEVSGRLLLYPVESMSLNPLPHDGLWSGGLCQESGKGSAETTLTLATCDPAAGLLAAEYARTSGFRLIVFPRSGGAALDLLHQRLVHVAALHRSTTEHPDRNAKTVREKLDGHYHLLRAAEWEEGVALPADNHARSPRSLARRSPHWATREPGSAARECLDELLDNRQFSGRQVDSHAAVAEAVHSGWADAGICVRFSAEEAGLNFLPVRTESLDLCFCSTMEQDPRIQALIRLLRTPSYRRLVSELPGYNGRHTGEVARTGK